MLFKFIIYLCIFLFVSNISFAYEENVYQNNESSTSIQINESNNNEIVNSDDSLPSCITEQKGIFSNENNEKIDTKDVNYNINSDSNNTERILTIDGGNLFVAGSSGSLIIFLAVILFFITRIFEKMG